MSFVSDSPSIANITLSMGVNTDASSLQNPVLRNPPLVDMVIAILDDFCLMILHTSMKLGAAAGSPNTPLNNTDFN
jgi:hypothetical protein